jgi:hypothetical protein
MTSVLVVPWLVLNFPEFLIARLSKARQWLPEPRPAPGLRVGYSQSARPPAACCENARGGGAAASSLAMTGIASIIRAFR